MTAKNESWIRLAANTLVAVVLVISVILLLRSNYASKLSGLEAKVVDLENALVVEVRQRVSAQDRVQDFIMLDRQLMDGHRLKDRSAELDAAVGALRSASELRASDLVSIGKTALGCDIQGIGQSKAESLVEAIAREATGALRAAEFIGQLVVDRLVDQLEREGRGVPVRAGAANPVQPPPKVLGGVVRRIVRRNPDGSSHHYFLDSADFPQVFHSSTVAREDILARALLATKVALANH